MGKRVFLLWLRGYRLLLLVLLRVHLVRRELDILLCMRIVLALLELWVRLNSRYLWGKLEHLWEVLQILESREILVSVSPINSLLSDLFFFTKSTPSLIVSLLSIPLISIPLIRTRCTVLVWALSSPLALCIISVILLLLSLIIIPTSVLAIQLRALLGFSVVTLWP